MYKSRITKHGRITIPKDLREKYGLNEDDRIVYVDLDDQILILPKPERIHRGTEKIQIDTEKMEK